MTTTPTHYTPRPAPWSDGWQTAGELVDLDPCYGAPATITYPDGRSVRLSVDQDEYTSVVDESDPYGWVGVLAWDRGTDEYGRPGRRPAGMTGAAAVVHRDGAYRVWHEPPADIRSDAAAVASLRGYVRDLLDCGYSVVTVELAGPDTDAYGRPVVHYVASLSSVGLVGTADESADHLRDVVAELLAIIAADAATDAATHPTD